MSIELEDPTATQDVPFTEYVRPNGLAKPTKIAMPVDVAALATELLEHGWQLTTEGLGNGHVCVECCNEEAALDMQIARSGQFLTAAAERMIRIAHKAWIAIGRPEAKDWPVADG